MTVRSTTEAPPELQRARRAMQGKSMEGMRCHFDILERRHVHLDLDGIEVSDLDEAVAQARRAVVELQQGEGLEVRFEAGAYMLVRVRTENLLCVIPLDKSDD